MKRILALILALLTVASSFFAFVGCTGPADTTAGDEVGENGIPVYKDGELYICGQGETNYQVVYHQGSNLDPVTGTEFKAALTALRKAFKGYDLGLIRITDDTIERDEIDTFVAPEYEILLGDTNRAESNVMDSLAFNEAVIRVVGKKVVIAGKNDTITIGALYHFIENYMDPTKGALTLPADLDLSVKVDLTKSETLDKTYADMSEEIWDSFNDEYFSAGWVTGSGWWDAAEILETYIDAYEATGDSEKKSKMLLYAGSFVRRNGQDWSYNEYNDDIMWACIGFARIALLTGQESYAKISKANFDKVWARAWDTRLGGGLYWKNDNKTKNSCVNCPAAIAACFLGQLYKDDSYYEKAKMIMDWEFKEMFDSVNGNVFDAYPLGADKSKWASTYNQGTFIGACTLLYQKYGEEIYLTNAAKAANYAMTRLTNGGILDNGEGNPASDNGDLIGFKGILTRWLYRYAKEVESLEVLTFLQKNLEKAYSNRNAEGLCWTQWQKKTPDGVTGDPNYRVFGMSTCVALAFNCHQWW